MRLNLDLRNILRYEWYCYSFGNKNSTGRPEILNLNSKIESSQIVFYTEIENLMAVTSNYDGSVEDGKDSRAKNWDQFIEDER